MIKSVSRSTGLSSVCLIIVLIVPLIQCSSIENEESSAGRFKRNTFTELGSKASASAESNVETFIVPNELGKTGGRGAPVGWPGAGGFGGWGGAGGKPGGWPRAGGPSFQVGHGVWPVAGGYGGWGGWNEKKGGSFGQIIGEIGPGADAALIPFQDIATYDFFEPIGNIINEHGSSLFKGIAKGFGGKGDFEKSAGPGIDYSKILSTYFATQPRGISENQPNGATISVV